MFSKTIIAALLAGALALGSTQAALAHNSRPHGSIMQGSPSLSKANG